MREALQETTDIEFAMIRYFKYADIDIADQKAGNGLGTLGRTKDEVRRHYQLPLKTPKNLEELKTDHDALLMWHFSRLITALELDLNLNQPLVFSEKPTGCPIDCNNPAIALTVVVAAVLFFLL